jgi:aspartyl-tRNA(Asn)/glutamyl-tRNA(Gln) amidotransferase subunit A
MSQLDNLTIEKAHSLLKNKKVSATEITQFYLEKLKKIDQEVRATLTICEDSALNKAKQIDQKISKDEKISILDGIPYTAKDMFLTEGIRTTAASKILDNFIPPFSATVIDKLDQAGAILIAKVNQDEFAHGASTENSAYHPTHNPIDLSKVPGGSSGGGVASVAADMCVFSIGTDTGGSIRQPSSFCGVVGLKPTYGLVSRYGVVAMASSFDVIGPITKTVKDSAIVLQTIAGKDQKDSTTVEADDYNYQPVVNKGKSRKLKIAFAKQHLEGLDEDNKRSFEKSLKKIESLNIEAKMVDMEEIALSLASYYILVPAEISSNLLRYDGIKYGYSDDSADDVESNYLLSREKGFGKEVKRRVMIGTYVLSHGYYDAYYKKAMQVRTLIKKQFDHVFNDYDLLVSPTAPTTAFELGENTKDPLKMYLADIMTSSVNLAGIPAISIPSGKINGMPTGLQIIGPQKSEQKVLSFAYKLEEALNEGGQ